MIKVIATYFTLRENLSQIETVLGVFCLLCLALVDLVSKTKERIYFNKYVHQLSIGLVIVSICFYFLTLLQISVLLLRENLLATVISSTIGFVWSQRVVEDHLKIELLLKEVKNLS